MTFERTFDYELIKRIVTHPLVYPKVADDAAPHWQNWEPQQSDSVHYVLISDGEEVLGFWAFFPENSTTWRAHICFLPNAYGEKTVQASREMIEWIWQNTPCQRIIGFIPLSNKLALRLVEAAGCRPFGLDDRSFLKNGVLEPRVAMGISRPAA
jgi:RimJ/RimL family protein N-acetyltransferase